MAGSEKRWLFPNFLKFGNCHLISAVFDEIASLAKLEGKTKSELFRDMVKVYEGHLDEERWQRLRRLGRATARKYRVTSARDIEKLIHETRGSRT